MNTRSGSADELDPGAYGSGHGFKLKTGNWESSRSPCRVLTLPPAQLGRRHRQRSLGSGSPLPSWLPVPPGPSLLPSMWPPCRGSRIPMALLWLAVCLTSVSGLLQTEEDPDSPIKNLRMEPGEKRLTWDLHGNVSGIMCFINSKFITKAINNNRYCQFQVLSSCEVKNFTVSLTKGPPFLMGIQYPLQEGNPGASAQRLDCWVHDMDFLTCSWEVGREAPSDVQYRLYRQHLWTRREQECPHYEMDDRGKHVRCHFNDVPRLEKQLQILVRGSSQSATIPCSDRTVELSEIERLNPPNITGTCNKSYSMMKWKVSSHFNRRYEYELQIQKGSDPAYTEKLQENFFELYNPGNYMARLKVKGFFRNTWSEWSAPQHFVCDVGEDVPRRDWLLSALGLLATLLVMGLAVVLCRRYSVLQKLFPPIPHMKDPTIDNLQSSKLVAWEASKASWEDCPVAEVQVLGET